VTVALADAELVRTARAGDPAGLGALLERHRARVHAVAVTLLGSGDRAEDAVHETFLIALQRLGDLRDPAAARPWLCAIVRNVCLQELRRPALEVSVPEPGALGGATAAVEEGIERTALREWVWGAIEALSEPLRLVVMLRYFSEASSYEAIAEVCGLPVGTVRSRLSAARAELLAALEERAAAETAVWRRDALARLRPIGEAFARLAQGERDGLYEAVAPDVAFALADRVPRRGVQTLADLLSLDIRDGMRWETTRVVPSAEISVVETRLVNPPDDPDHCPPAVTQVLVHPDGPVARMLTRYAARESVAD
jgi:RNA polymerase sigma factor (sigma-70 family)